MDENEESEKTESVNQNKAIVDDTLDKLKIEIEKRLALEDGVSKLSEALLAQVPENLKAIIPADLSPAERAAWFMKAKETGVFDKQERPVVPETDTTTKSVPE